MKQIYFVHRDPGANGRQSDGVELCIIPEFYDEHIYFYCSQYVVFWRSVDEAGAFDKTCNFKLKGQIRPATLTEVCEGGLCERVDSVKEYELVSGKISAVKYIHLR